MNFAQQNRNPARHLPAIGTVALLHLIAGYALISGLARKVVDLYQKPVDVSIIEEAKVLPPPPPPKPLKLAAPPPAYAPPAEIPVTAQAAPNAIVATTAAAPPEAPVQQAPPPATVGAACPNHLAVRARVPYPPLAQRQGINGDVLIEFTVGTDGSIGNVAVLKSSSPIFENTVINAVSKFQCVGQGHPVRVRVPFAFRLEN